MNPNGSCSMKEWERRGYCRGFDVIWKFSGSLNGKLVWHLNQLCSCFSPCLVGNHFFGHWFRSIYFLFVWSSAWVCFSLLSPSATAAKVRSNPQPWKVESMVLSLWNPGGFVWIHTRKRLPDFPEKVNPCSNHFFTCPLHVFSLSLMHVPIHWPLIHADLN